MTQPSIVVDTCGVNAVRAATPAASTGALPGPALLSTADATTFAECFACIAEPTRIRLLHAVAAGGREVSIGELTTALDISQSTCSHHVRKLAEVGFVLLRKHGTATLVKVNPACCTWLPHAADAVMGMLGARPCCPEDVPADVTVRAMRTDDWPAVRRIYAEGIATGHATFETEVPDRRTLEQKWLAGHRWVAEIDGRVAGWAALTAASNRGVYAGVAENSIYVGEASRARGVGKALIRHQVIAADHHDIWTLQTSMFPENRASIALHLSAGFRTLGVRERIAQHHGTWRDTVLLERRRAADPA